MVVPLSQFPDLFGEKIQNMVHTGVFLIQLVEHMLLTFSNVWLLLLQLNLHPRSQKHDI